MDWISELKSSALWIATAFVLSSIVLLLVGAMIVRFTHWGRQFWLLAKTFFSPKYRGYMPLVQFGIILFLSLFGVRLSVLFSNWYNGMYTSLQQFDEQKFWIMMIVFSVLATIHVIRILINYYLQQAFSIRWREELNERLLGQWLNHKSYYRTFYLKNPIDNPDQRIQQDITSFVSTSLDLCLGVVSSLVSAVAFTVILWNLSGKLTILGLTIPRGMVFMVFMYVLIATVVAFKIGRPLIRLNFLNERLNANYRYSLIRVREYAESIAFYRGERIEGEILRHRFKEVIGNMWDIVHRSIKFQGFNLAISQLAVIFPIIIQAPRFFSKQLTLGGLMQTAQAFGTLHDNISFFRNAYDTFAGYRAVLDRLTGFINTIEQADRLPIPDVKYEEGRVALSHVSVYAPDLRPLATDLNFEVQSGEFVLLQGRSGIGKTTLLRTIAGLWPYCEGQIIRPQENTLFLSQKPYLPEGKLIDAMYYPLSVPKNQKGIEQASQLLIEVNLAHLIPSLQKEDSWTHQLSLGEQQRIAIARLLLIRPKVAFIDEATSALDEGLEDAMYRLIRQQLPELKLMSIGHRSTLWVHHQRLLTLQGGGRWEFHPIESQAT